MSLYSLLRIGARSDELRRGAYIEVLLLITEMILVIDNYDSFTYNLVQYLGELGAQIEVRRNDQTTLEEDERMSPERIVISPGPKTPTEAGICLELIKTFSGRAPI